MKCHKLEVVDTFCSLLGGVGHRQAFPLSIVVSGDADVLPELGGKPMSCGEENGSDNLHLFEVVDGFVFQRRIHYHLQKCLCVGIRSCRFPFVDELSSKVEDICGLLLISPPQEWNSK